MPTSLTDQYLAALSERSSDEVSTAVEIVDSLLASAQAAGASDVHIIPDSSGSQVCWRIDGVLHEVTRIGAEIAPNVVARLKVLAELLTYRTEIPQEGRVRHTDFNSSIEPLANRQQLRAPAPSKCGSARFRLSTVRRQLFVCSSGPGRFASSVSSGYRRRFAAG